VREFLARHIAAPAEQETTPPPAVAETPVQAIARLRREVAAAPEKPELKLDLALALMQAGQADAAQVELDSLPANLAEDARAKRLHNQLDLARALKDAPDMAELRARLAANANDHAARDLLGVRLLLEDDPAAGLDQFLAVLEKARDWNDGQGKKRLLAAFATLDDAELVSRYRRRMASLLF
jgi:putative thioredoxin